MSACAIGLTIELS